MPIMWKKFIRLAKLPGLCRVGAFCFLIASAAQAKQPESYYQDIWCKQYEGITEYTLPDLTRCDCLTDTHAVEVEFGRKWAEVIGQALYYALQTGHKAGIILILESEKDYKYWLRLNTTIEHHGLEIDTWKIGPVEGILLKRHND
jgi:hypothetical protein